MSKRDGRIYVAARLVRELETNTGLPILIANNNRAGCLFAYWTKTAARKVHGRNVELIEIRAKRDGDL